MRRLLTRRKDNATGNWAEGTVPTSANTTDVYCYQTGAGNLTNAIVAGSIEVQQTTTLGGE